MLLQTFSAGHCKALICSIPYAYFVPYAYGIRVRYKNNKIRIWYRTVTLATGNFSTGVLRDDVITLF